MSIQGDKKKLGLILSGQPLPIESANIFVTQPKVKDIVLFGEEDFLATVQLLTNMEQFTDMVKKGNFNLEVISDFQLLLMIISQDPTVKNMTMNLFNLIFPDYEIEITENSIDFLLGQEKEEKHVIGRLHPFNFQEFQNILNDAFIPQVDNEREPDYNPANDMAKEIAEKIKRGREKVHALQAESESPHSIFCNYCSILSIGMNMDVNIFFNYTPFQLYDSHRRYFEKVKHDFYMRVSTMPLMDTSKMDEPSDWYRTLY